MPATGRLGMSPVGCADRGNLPSDGTEVANVARVLFALWYLGGSLVHLAAFELTTGGLILSRGRYVRLGFAMSILFNLYLVQQGLGSAQPDLMSDFLMNARSTSSSRCSRCRSSGSASTDRSSPGVPRRAALPRRGRAVNGFGHGFHGSTMDCLAALPERDETIRQPSPRPPPSGRGLGRRPSASTSPRRRGLRPDRPPSLWERGGLSSFRLYVSQMKKVETRPSPLPAPGRGPGG